MKTTRIFSAIALSLSLAACGGGGGGGGADPVTNDGGSGSGGGQDPVSYHEIGGKAFDGYIVGGTVWMDIDGDGVMDDDEPRDVTKSGGDYTLELTDDQEACLAWSTIYVDVPVGAMDEQEGEVLEAYQMSFPPSLDPEATQSEINISPLTTVIWDSVATALRNTGTSISCASLSGDEELVSFIQETIEQGQSAVVRHYNVSEEDLYTDFIADGNTELQAKAVEIVRGLQASLRETIELSDANPESDVRVQYYTGTDLDEWETPDTWYRDAWIWYPDGTAENSVTQVSDDLTTDVRTIVQWTERTTDYGTHVVKQSTIWETRDWSGETVNYNCDIKEEIEWYYDPDELELGLVNLRAERDALAFEDCVAAWQNPIHSQYVIVWYEPSEEVRAGAQFTYKADTTGLFDYTMNEETANEDSLNDLGLVMAQLPYQNNLADLAGADRVTRFNEWHKADGTVEWIFTNVTRYLDGKTWWERVTEYVDGTTLKECAVVSGEWTSCDEVNPW